MRALGIPEAVLNGSITMGTNTSAMQCHPDNEKQLPSPDKSQMLLNIATYYSVKPSEMIFFDDTEVTPLLSIMYMYIYLFVLCTCTCQGQSLFFLLS